VNAPVVGVLALQGDVREHVDALDAVGAQGVRVRRAEEFADLDGLVLPGGESTTMSRLLQVFDLLDPLRKAVTGGLPTYGTCAGMILLADRLLDGRPDQQTIGGIDMTVRRNAFGRQVDSFETDLDLHLPAAGGSAFHAVFIRAPWVESVGPDVEVLARLGSGPAAGTIVAVRQGHLWATSFHPELTGDTRLHAAFVATLDA
jgi:pyridoxal 5'-phosphate synthase pdxT subunit